jgi:hypothetical protein
MPDSTQNEVLRILSEQRGKISCETKQVLRNGISHYFVTIVAPNGSEYRLEAFGEEAQNLEKAIAIRKRYEEPEGLTPKIFIGGNGTPDEPPAAAGCTNQAKSTGLPGQSKHIVQGSSSLRKSMTS